MDGHHFKTIAISKYRNSRFHLLCSVFPEYDWLPWKFPRAASNCWENTYQLSKFLNNIKERYCISKPADWFRKISTRNWIDEGGVSLNSKYGGLPQVLSMAYPGINWNQVAASPSTQLAKCSKPHQHLVKQLQLLELASDLEVNFKHPNLRHSKSETPFEFDIFIPSLSLVMTTMSTN